MLTDPDDLDERPGIRGYVDVLRRRWLIVLSTVVVVSAVTLGSALTDTPVYRSSADVVVDSTNPTTTLGLVNETLTTQELATQVQILTSETVAERAAESLGLGLSGPELLTRVMGITLGDTRVLRVVAADVDPQRATDVANAFADAFIDHRREESLQRLVDAGASLRARQSTLQARLEEVDEEIAGVAEDDPEFRSLLNEQVTLENQIAQIGAQLNGLEGSQLLVSDSGEVIRRASVPSTPDSPRPVEDGMLGLAVGALLGVGLAFGRDHLDDAVRSDAQAAAATGGRPVLAFVPILGSVVERQGPLELLRDGNSLGSEAIRTLRTNLRFVIGRGTLRSCLVTSPGPGDGKSTIAANLSVAMAQSGSRVLLVDGDMRRPSLHRSFGVPNGLGLSTVLTGQHALHDVVVDVGIPRLRLLTAGATPPNPVELLATAQPLLAEAAADVDTVIIDGPPLLAVADSLEVSSLVDGVLLVLAHGETRQRDIRESARRLHRVGALLMGSVLNLAPEEVGYYYGYRLDPDDADGAVVEPPPSRVS